MTRTLTLTAWLEPTRCTTRSWSARRSLACTAKGISLTSSRTRVPPAATSNQPVRRPAAPVKEPRSWPKSSDSTSVSASAQQFTATKGPLARGLASWMKRAISSLPVPVSPWMSTVASVPATRRARASAVSMCGLSVSTGAFCQPSPARLPRVSESTRRISWRVTGLLSTRVAHLAKLGEGLLAVRRRDHFGTASLDGLRERLAHHRLVVHHHDRRDHLACSLHVVLEMNDSSAGLVRVSACRVHPSKAGRSCRALEESSRRIAPYWEQGRCHAAHRPEWRRAGKKLPWR